MSSRKQTRKSKSSSPPSSSSSSQSSSPSSSHSLNKTKRAKLSITIPEPVFKTRKDSTLHIDTRPLFLESVLMNIFEDIFKKENGYSVVIDGNFINIYLTSTNTDTGTEKIRCLELLLQKVRDTYVLYIIHVNNCEVPSRAPELGKGGQVLKRLVANIRNYEEFKTVEVVIELDASGIFVKGEFVPLNFLQILCNGETWYNKLGFKEVGYEDNVIAMQIFINEPIKLLPKDPQKKEFLQSLGYKKGILKVDFYNAMNERIKKIPLLPKDKSIMKEIKYYIELIHTEEKLIRKIFKNMGTDKFSFLAYDFSNNSV